MSQTFRVWVVGPAVLRDNLLARSYESGDLGKALARGSLVTPVSTPVQGEMLAGRYRLDAPVYTVPNSMSTSHTIWRGTDDWLNRPVAIELRVPGGESAQPMIDTAVTAGRIGHPNVVGVYDAVNKPKHAFVVRKWVDGRTLTQAVADGPLNPAQAAAIARGAAEGIAAIHAIGQAHGNLTPDAVVIGQDREITLTELKLSPHAPLERDVRAIGGLLYTALTGHWPRELGWQVALPDAIRVDGKVCSPRQVRAGIPAYLDALTMDLLDPTVAAPTAAELAAELWRYDITDPELSPLSTFAPEPAPERPLWKRALVPGAALTCIVVAGLLVGTRGLPFNDSKYPISDDPTKRKPGMVGEKIEPTAAAIFDPDGDGTESAGADKIIDGDPDTYWQPAAYTAPDFGAIKPGMGVLVDLGEPREVKQVKVNLTAPGATVQLRTATERGDAVAAYQPAADPQSDAAETVTFTLNKPVTSRYLLVWISSLPKVGHGDFSYSVGVSEVTVAG